jgi:subtilisin-like proprotein convertase family protein
MRVKTTLLAILLLACFNLFAQNNFWIPISATTISPEVFEKNYKPAVYKAFHLDEQALRSSLLAAPMESSININNSPVIITLPNAQGGFENYKVVESPVMEQGLADKYPMIKTYLGIATDQSGSTVSFDLTPRGFHAQVLSPGRKTFYINTVDKNNGHYIVFDRNGMNTVTDFDCNTAELMNKSDVQNQTEGADDGLRRTFRLAVTVNGEYSQACLNGTETTDAQRTAKVLAMLTTNLNRANAIYNRDFGIKMNFVSGMDVVLYLDPATDPFNTTGSGWNSTTQVTLNTEIGSSNYDIGHFIAKVPMGDENGNAGCIGCVCKTNKGSGYTAHYVIQGDPLAVEYWCHEMGHQFGANHTFTWNVEGTGANMEPGSGSTIMGYAGITGPTDVQSVGDDYFHAKSIDQVTTYLKSPAGATCAVATSTGNATPVVNAGADYTIPKSTPFVLAGTATDANGDVMSYCWEQYDDYGSGSNTFPQASSPSGPVFRSMLYSTNLQRTFPLMSTVLSGATSSTWEAVPSVARTMKFRFTARDNAVTGAANNSDDAIITVDGSTGPFGVTAPNTSVTPWKVGEFQTIAWNVAGTTGGAVNCANVAIDLSTDGGTTFPIVLVASTPNDGSHEIIIPNNVTSFARVRVRAVGNVFFDVSNSNFAIQASTTAQFVLSNPPDITACSGSTLTTTLNTASILGYSTAINFTASGNPAGSTVAFSANSIAPGNNVNVTLQGTVPAGTHVITVTGTSGSIVKTRTITFNVVSPTLSPALSSPANAALSQPPSPSFSWTGITGATAYKLEISTNSSFTGIVATANNLTTTSHTITSSLGPNTQYYWRVTASTICGNLVSAARSFTTSASSCGNVTSTDVPKTIASASPNTVQSTLNIGGSGIITDVDVIGLQGTHSWISDLKISLQSPVGTTVTLFDEICDDEPDFSLNLDDAAATATFPCPPVGNVTVQPESLLSAFNGQNCNGTWKLTVQDKYSQDGGSLNAWGLKICLASGSLPVTWLDFTARRNGEKAVLVQWTTASEVNNKLFEVQRSRDGIYFEKIGSINAGTAPTGVQQYLFNDMKPFAGVNYYRLKQVDVDGRSAFSSIAKVIMPNDKTLYSINPNPATTKATFTALSEIRKANIKMVDVSGKTVYSVSRTIINAGEIIDIPVNGFAKGYYLVMIESQNGRFTEKLVVQ